LGCNFDYLPELKYILHNILRSPRFFFVSGYAFVMYSVKFGGSRFMRFFLGYLTDSISIRNSFYGKISLMKKIYCKSFKIHELLRWGYPSELVKIAAK
jgi:hypothetical protein